MSIILKFIVIITRPSYFIRSYSKFSESNLKKLLEAMPKEPKHVADAQRQRLKIKDRIQKYVPGKVTVQVLGSGAEGAPKALYMFTDNSRYLFNCGEGTQRLAHEHKMKLSKLEHIFITEPSWSNIGGLPGVSLTIQDVGVPQITLHGPDGLDELFLATRRFIVLKDLTIRMAECTAEQQFVDNVMSITYVPIIKTPIEKKSEEIFMDKNQDKETQSDVMSVSDASTSTRSSKNRKRSRSKNKGESSEDDTDYYAHERKRKRKKNRSRSRARSESVPTETAPFVPLVSHMEREQNTTMCYICRLQPRPGSLNIERCVEMRVPPGPLLGQLKSGKDITLKDGSIVKSEDVCFPDDPGPIMLVVDCPSEEYFDSFLYNEAFVKHQATARHDNDLAYLVVHFSPSHIIKHPRYREWVDKFSPSTQHLVLNDTNVCMGSSAVHRIQYKLNMLHEDIFPLLGDNGTKIHFTDSELNIPCIKKPKMDIDNKLNCETSELIDSLTVNSKPNNPGSVFIQPNTFCKFHLRPKKGLEREGELVLEPMQYIEETMAVNGFESILQELRESLNAKKKNLYVNEYPRILFLGTGSCIPNKTRNTSGILVETSDSTNILMDCGEGTYGQLVRFYGQQKAKSVLRNLKAIYISHLHADHHIGLIGVLKGRRRAFKKLGIEPETLTLLAPKQILAWLHFYHRRFENISDDYDIIGTADLILNAKKLPPEELQWIKNLEMNEIKTVPVRHCPNAYGVRFNHKNGWSITYSGDTMPSEQLAALGHGSNLLIHEATMEDELANEAIFKMHSTTSQAIAIGQKMKAKHIILTHFSQRYAKLPRFNDNFAENIGIAFDNMHVRLDELPLVPLLYPALRLMFAEHYEELEHKAVKRQLRAERNEACKENAD